MSLRPTDIITVTRLGHTFKASRRTVAHLDLTIYRFRRQYPKAQLRIIQACYNTGVRASAGTHDYDAVFDFGFTGTLAGKGAAYDWKLLQAFLRTYGWGCWWRHTGTWAAQSAWHVHGFSLPEKPAWRTALHMIFRRFATKVGEWIDGGYSLFGRKVGSSQLEDYCNRTFGLANQHVPGSDRSWFPSNIDATTFIYSNFLRAHPKWSA